ncbi:hypothetical protein BDQ17DRAFT_1352545 [Cyathus striatus]|nr:hypothetical protein BDQ17DRAFT_1352545 [Cyathus striatus]
MSGVIRSQANRSRSRNALASPYARPRQQKKSSWSITGLLGYLNPFAARPSPERSPSPTVPPESPTSEDEDALELPESAHTLASRGHEISASLNGHSITSHRDEPPSVPPPPVSPLSRTSTKMHPTSPSFFHESESPVKNLETVSAFLNSKVGQPITPIEMEGVLSLLQRSAPQEGSTPFRFESRSPSATPARGISPFVPAPTFKFSTPEPSVITTPAVTTRRTLSKNPNGVYRWQGGGSARASRTKNRFSSPAFGPSRTATGHIVLKDNGTTESSKTDSKRRRIGEDASSSFSAPAGVERNTSPTTSLPAASTTTSSHAATKTSVPLSSTARLRVPALQKPTAPAVPSPLRQAWSEGSSPSDRLHTPVSKPSKAANFMTELIKEATPPKKPDVSNPYQTANPVAKVATRRLPKRTRAAGRKEQKEAIEREKKEKEKEEIEHITPQAIIEATLPKGSKRSRPPTHFEKSPEKPSFAEDVEEDEEEDHRVSKKSKPFLNGNGPSLPSLFTKSASATVVEEINEVDMEIPEKQKSNNVEDKAKAKETPPPASVSPSISLSPPGNRGLFGNYKANSIPKEPSKLRFSVVVDGNSPGPTQPSPVAPALANTKASSSLTSVENMDTQEDGLKVGSKEAFTPTTSSTSVSSAPSVPSDPKEQVRRLAIKSLPIFTFTNNGISMFPSTPEHMNAREQAQNIPKSSLGSFDFSADALKKASVVRTNGPSASALPSIYSSAPVPVISFNWAATGAKPPAPATDSWTCSVCMIKNPVSKEICAACEAPGPSKPNPTPTTGFDWAAAGMKAPSAPAAGSWTCSVCMISNSISKDICAACESSR